MSMCGENSAVKFGEGQLLIASIKCRSWGCDDCAPHRKDQLVAKALEGAPERFVTLTVNPAIGSGPLERRDRLAWAWALIIKRLRRWKPEVDWQYLAVVEKTKAGEPHLHVLLRGGYIPHALLSAWMDELTDAPIVDIRAIDSARKAARYVAKYIGKAPEQFGRFKRYWSSRNWTPKWAPASDEWLLASDPWEFEQRRQAELIYEYEHFGYAFRRLRDAVVIGFLPFNEFRPAPT